MRFFTFVTSYLFAKAYIVVVINIYVNKLTNIYIYIYIYSILFLRTGFLRSKCEWLLLVLHKKVGDTS